MEVTHISGALAENKTLKAENERIAKLLEEAEADKKFLAERLKLRDGEVERLTYELEAVKEDFNEFGEGKAKEGKP
jgi:predicted nuclease with TOPRIM domain